MTASYGTTVGFDAIAVALLGRTSPIGIVARGAACSAPCAAGAGAMQIQAGVPAELVDVLQASILFFLVASPVVRASSGSRRAKGGVDERRDVHRARTAASAGRAELMDVLYGIPVIGLVFQLVGYLVDVLPVIAPIIVRAATPDRLRGAVRRHVRAIRRRQHRHRGHDAVWPRSSASSSAGFVAQPCPAEAAGRSSGVTPALLLGLVLARARARSSSRASMPGCRSPSGPTRSSAARSSTSPRSGYRLPEPSPHHAEPADRRRHVHPLRRRPRR